MGLDMYLTGEKFIIGDWQNPDNNPTEDGYRLESRRLRLGYWRKHPDLHGYIVENFVDGVDDCRAINLGIEALKQIIEAIQNNRLPKTEGFFFGESDNDDEQKSEAIDTIERAIAWASAPDAEHWRSVYYQASW